METRTRPIPTGTSIARPTTRRREVEVEGLTWFDLPQPVNADIAFLREHLRLDPLALEDVLSTIQIPKIDVAAEQIFLILQVPNLDREQRVVVSQVAIFVGREFVVTTHDATLKPLRRLFAAVAGDETMRRQVLGRGPGYLVYRILDALIKHSFPVSYHLDDQIAQLQAQLASPEALPFVGQLVALERDTLSLHHMVRPNAAVCDTLRSLDSDILRAGSGRFFGDNADGMHKLEAVTAEQRETLASLGRARALLNQPKPLPGTRVAIIAVLLLVPLVLLAALALLVLPPTQQPIVFATVLLVTLAGAGGLVGLGFSRRWF